MRSAASKRAIDWLYELATRLPWWGGLLSALAVYTLLHAVAVLQMPTPAGTVDVVATAVGQLFILLANIGQYLLPLAFLIAAAISGFSRWKRAELRETVALDTSGSILRRLRWADFELLLRDAFRHLGYEVCAASSTKGTNNGVFALSRNGRLFLVDCTDWRSWKAGASAVRELYAQMKEAGARGGYAVTSGQFTPEAMHFAAEKSIRLIDGRKLKELVRSQPQPPTGNPRGIRFRLRSDLARFKTLIAMVRGTARRKAQAREPEVFSPSDRFPKPDAALADSKTGDDIAETVAAEIAAGRLLAALIRGDRGIEGEIALSAPPVQRPRIARSRPRWKLPRVPAIKIADTLGALLAMGALWGAFEWFVQLPDVPAATPWALLGTDSDSEAMRRRLQGLGRAQSAAKILEGGRPLGQYRFGPPPGFLTATRSQVAPGNPVPPEPVEVYHSLRELEMAFNDKYVPPPECYAFESNNLMVKCGNHRIRARRTFIASGGKVTPTLLGSWEDPRTLMTTARPGDWRQPVRADWRRESTGRWEQDWQQGAEQDTPQPRDQAYAPESDQDLLALEAPKSVPVQPQQESREDTPWDPQQDHWLDQRRQWPQEPVEQTEVESQHDWRQEWAQGPTGGPDGTWRRDWERQPAQDSTLDLGQQSLRNGEGDWGSDWRSQPLPVERRHWVDDL